MTERDKTDAPLVPKGCGTLLIIAALIAAVIVWKKFFGG